MTLADLGTFLRDVLPVFLGERIMSSNDLFVKSHVFSLIRKRGVTHQTERYKMMLCTCASYLMSICFIFKQDSIILRMNKILPTVHTYCIIQMTGYLVHYLNVKYIYINETYTRNKLNTCNSRKKTVQSLNIIGTPLNQTVLELLNTYHM